MIITRTPYRISFFGGGTDYHTWYEQFGSQVLSTTINHYCYLSCRYLPPFFDHRSRIVWSEVERINETKEIKHVSVRAVLDYLKIEQGIEIQHQGDLPARSGLGSSSSFTVGLLNALTGLQGNLTGKRELARQAIHVERDLLKENVGVQDQIATAFGGFNRISIGKDGHFDVEPMVLPSGRMQELQQHFLLFFSGISRTASHIAAEKVRNIPNKQNIMMAMQDLVQEAVNVLVGGGDLNEFGRLLDESWQLKRQISNKISSDFIDDIYQTARKAGALGGKLLGAGGGGFLLFFVPPEKQAAVLDALGKLLLVPFEFENSGSQVVFYEPRQYSKSAMQRRDFVYLDADDAATPTASIVETEKL